MWGDLRNKGLWVQDYRGLVHGLGLGGGVGGRLGGVGGGLGV